jgi:hypothetical protein
MSARVEHRRGFGGHRHPVTVLPKTTLGWWAIGLAAAFFPLALTAGYEVLPGGGRVSFACAVASGAAGLTAIVRDGERALVVFVALAPLLFAVAFELAELIGSWRRSLPMLTLIVQVGTVPSALLGGVAVSHG